MIVTTKKGQKGKPKINFTSNLGLTTMGANREVFDAKGYMQYREDWYTANTYGMNTATNAYEAYQIPTYQAGAGQKTRLITTRLLQRT